MDEQNLSLEPVAIEKNDEKPDAPDYVKELLLHAIRQQRMEEKRLLVGRITMALVACILVLFICVSLVCVPPLVRAVQTTQSVLDKLNQSLLSEDTMGIIPQLHSSLSAVGSAAEQLDSFDVAKMNEAIVLLTDSVKTLSEIDIDMLNEAIKNLNDTVAPFARFFSKF